MKCLLVWLGELHLMPIALTRSISDSTSCVRRKKKHWRNTLQLPTKNKAGNWQQRLRHHFGVDSSNHSRHWSSWCMWCPPTTYLIHGHFMWLLKEMTNKHVQIPENDVMDFIIHTKINMLRMLLPFKKSVWGWSLGKNSSYFNNQSAQASGGYLTNLHLPEILPWLFATETAIVVPTDHHFACCRGMPVTAGRWGGNIPVWTCD